jgi:L-asparaginase
MGVGTLIDTLPELREVASISEKEISNVASFDFDEALLLKLTKAIKRKLADPKTHGVVVTHGTDTMEETAFFLDLAIDSKKPVVLVGAMRPPTAIGADGPMNLLEAVVLAAHPDAMHRGVMVVLNDRIGSGRYITKTNSTTVDTFKSEEQGYLGTFVSGVPHFYYEPARPAGRLKFNTSNLKALPKVEIIYGHPNQNASLLDMVVQGGAKGIVMAGMGNGAVPSSIKPKVKELMAKGIPVVLSTRCGAGFVSAKPDGIGAGYLNPQKARILLSLALAEGASIDKIRSCFGT